jgi:hypothetical protein
MTNSQKYWEEKLSISSTVTTKNLKTLDDFHRIEMIKSWGQEITQSKDYKDKGHWSLIGHGILYFMENIEDGEILTSLVARQAKFNFINVSKHEVIDAFKTEIPKETLAPCLIYLEPGDWMRSLDKDKPDADIESFQRYLQNLIAHFDPNFPVVFTTSVKRLADIDPSFRKQGVFDRRFEITERTLIEKGHDFVKQIGFDICDTSITEQLDKVGKLVDHEYDDRRIQGVVAIALKRIQVKINRQLNFLDLIDMSSHGSGERDAIPVHSDKYLDMIAAHEAGHVAAAILDSNGVNIPEYATAFPGRDFSGLVVDSYDYMKAYHRRMSYRDYEHKIRVGLGGRIAEHIILGAENMTVNTASSDLESATNMCRTMFGFSGISPDIRNPENVSDNLAVIVERSTASEDIHVENLTRQYLKKQYDNVFNIFSLNKDLLIQIINRLKAQRVLDQKELHMIYKSYLAKSIKKAA